MDSSQVRPLQPMDGNRSTAQNPSNPGTRAGNSNHSGSKLLAHTPYEETQIHAQNTNNQAQKRPMVRHLSKYRMREGGPAEDDLPPNTQNLRSASGRRRSSIAGIPTSSRQSSNSSDIGDIPDRTDGSTLSLADIYEGICNSSGMSPYTPESSHRIANSIGEKKTASKIYDKLLAWGKGRYDLHGAAAQEGPKIRTTSQLLSWIRLIPSTFRNS